MSHLRSLGQWLRTLEILFFSSMITHLVCPNSLMWEWVLVQSRVVLKMGSCSLLLKTQYGGKAGRKESLLYLRCQQLGARDLGEGEDSCPKVNSLHPNDNQWARAFIGGRRGLHGETSQSAMTSSWNWSDQSHLDCFKNSSSSAPGSVCSHLFGASSGIMAAYVLTTIWSSCN